MASLHIDFGYDDNVKRNVTRAKNALDSRINDYGGIRNKLDNFSAGTSNLSTANTYLRKKINALEDKRDDLARFHAAVDTFDENASAADRRVADRIKREYKDFCKREGIQTGLGYEICRVIAEGIGALKDMAESFLAGVLEAVKNTWEIVKQWYKDNKHWIDIIVDAVVFVAAVVGVIASIATGGTAAAIIFGLWGVAKATTDLVFDCCALDAYNRGDMELYAKMSESGMKELMTYYMGDVGTALYYGMEIASFVYNVCELKKTIKGKPNDATKADVAHKLIGTKAISKAPSKVAKWNTYTNFQKNITKASVILGNISFGLKAGRNLLKEDKVADGVLRSISITSSAWNARTSLDKIGELAFNELRDFNPILVNVSKAPSLRQNPAIKINVNISLINHAA